MEEQMNYGALYSALSAIVVSAVSAVHIGSVRSAMAFAEEKRTKEVKTAAMTTGQATRMPIIGSAVLFGLFLLFRYVSIKWVNLGVQIYFCFLGAAVLDRLFNSSVQRIVRKFVAKDSLLLKVHRFNLPRIASTVLMMDTDIALPFSFPHALTTLGAILFGVHYMMSKNWIANNVFAFLFSVHSIEVLRLGTFNTSAILLGGLFFYDIFWVFRTNVMVKVAVSLEAPIKMVFPKSFSPELKFAMLGLGDIIIPGMFIAFVLRFEKHLARKNKGKRSGISYYWVVLISYFLGLVLTIVVMQVFHHAQPALLYLVPATLGSVFGLAFFKGELKLLLSYSEDGEDDKDKDKDENTKED